MADGVFTYKGAHYSSQLPTIVIDGKEIDREQFRKDLIAAAVEKIPVSESPVYLATGGGYGSNETLFAHENKTGVIKNITSIKGEQFRNHPAFEAEKAEIRKAIEAHVGAEAIKANPNIIEQTLRTFYSDEVNTRIGKQIVIEAYKYKKEIEGKKTEYKAAAYESASLYQDTVTRAENARDEGAKTVLVAGDMSLETALTKQATAVNRFNTAASYKIFAARFKDELVPLFDEIRIYNTDGPEPVLIAEKKGKGQELTIVKGQEAKYNQFLEKKDIDLAPYTRDEGFNANKVSQELQDIIKARFGMDMEKLGGLTPGTTPKNTTPGKPLPPRSFP